MATPANCFNDQDVLTMDAWEREDFASDRVVVFADAERPDIGYCYKRADISRLLRMHPVLRILLFGALHVLARDYVQLAVPHNVFMSAADARGLSDERTVFIVMNPVGTVDSNAPVVKLSHIFQHDVKEDLVQARDWILYLLRAFKDPELQDAEAHALYDKCIEVVASTLQLSEEDVHVEFPEDIQRILHHHGVPVYY